MPGTADQSQWKGVIEGATHMNFTQKWSGADHFEPLVTKTITAFLAGVRAHCCALPGQTREMILRVKRRVSASGNYFIFTAVLYPSGDQRVSDFD